MLTVAIWIGVVGIAIHVYGFFRGLGSWDAWAESMVIKSAGFVVIVISLTLLTVWWVQQ